MPYRRQRALRNQRVTFCSIYAFNDHGTCLVHGKKHIAVVDRQVSCVVSTVHPKRTSIGPIAAGEITKKGWQLTRKYIGLEFTIKDWLYIFRVYKGEGTPKRRAITIRLVRYIVYKYRTTSEIIFDLLIQDFTIQNFRDKVSAKWASTDTAVCCRKPHVLCGSYILGSADYCQSNAKSMLQRMYCERKGSVARVRRAALARRLAASVTEERGHGPLNLTH